MTSSIDHAQRLESMISGLLTHAAAKLPSDEPSADEDEIGRLGEELLNQPGAASEIGDVFDRIVRMDSAHRDRRIALLEASWQNVGSRPEE